MPNGTELMLSVQNSDTEFRENPADGLVAGTKSKTEGCGLSIWRCLSLRKEILPRNVLDAILTSPLCSIR